MSTYYRAYFVTLGYELKFLKSLLEKLGIQSKVLSEEDIEDLGLSMLMKDINREERVSEEDVLNKLKS